MDKSSFYFTRMQFFFNLTGQVYDLSYLHTSLLWHNSSHYLTEIVIC